MVLKQNTGQQAAVINLIESARERYDGSLTRVKRDKASWQRLVNETDSVVRNMPLWKLQTIGNENVEFLYENVGEGNEIELLPGVAYNFRKFHSLIQDLVRGAWVRHIRGIRDNREVLGESADLQEFLFGSEREGLDIYREFLNDIQDGECFYCKGTIRGPGDVDHFIPWVKYPVDLGHNFVLADSVCNRKKSDYLAAESHLDNWFERNNLHLKSMQDYFDDNSIYHNLNSSNQITCWAYEQAENAKAHVWVLDDKVHPISTYWRNLCWEVAIIEELAADKPE
jgi:5-methylcytosine-specific restriction endonuclease McrA